ncbi:hypothetical protein AJ79_09836 [Helicocarpus griseus UAMH5409]|uniref:Uncharacterized protein n=1 Tax=Helicocarpus griseus UAMH5409 TaxID=1447875 RepID=A0A2B7WGI7_9EURO|nr:hypothetical protein AJ79_09836 [Helicocarpus griseus UAMH5409]
MDCGSGSLNILPNSPPPEETFPTLEIPANGPELASGFPYNQRLFQLHISPDEWTQFSDELAHSARLTTLEKCAVWTVGIGTGIVATPLAAFSGYYAGKSMKNRRVAKKVRQGQKGKGELETTLSDWNENVFRDKGFRVWLRLPRAEQKKLEEKLEEKLEKKDGGKKGKGEREDEDDDSNASASLRSSQLGPVADQADSKPGFKADVIESASARKKREKLEARKLERHYALVVEDIRKPLGAGQSLEFGVVEIDDGASSTRGDPPEYAAELHETALPPGAVLHSRGIHEMEA